MHGASAVARNPERLKKIFYNDGLSNNGIYALRMYVLGVPITVTIDDRFPLVEGNSIFAAASPDGALWGILIEKAIAKIYGSYESIVGGDPSVAIEMLTGAPSERYHHTDKTALEVWDLIREAEANGNMLSSSTPGTTNTKTSDLGIVGNHVYTILDTSEAFGKRLIRMRNPWGRETYSGPWRDDDASNWDLGLRYLVDYADENEGIFWIDYLTYHSEFLSTTVHFDTTEMKQSYFLGLDDYANYNYATGPYSYFLAKRHEFTITSPVDQKIYISSHVWPLKSYPDDCKGLYLGPQDSKHYIQLTDKDRSNRVISSQIRTWWRFDQSMNFDAIELKAGQQLQVVIELDWKTNSSRDFSLVVWSDGSQEVEITSDLPYSDTIRSAFPLTERR